MSFDGDSDAVYAWAAGILEGEGCFSIHRRKDRSNTLNTAIHCEMTDEDIIRRLHAVFKVGTVNARKICLAAKIRALARPLGFGQHKRKLTFWKLFCESYHI